MLHEPELSLVKSWLDNGGAVKAVPFGVSGDAWTFAQVARQSGCWGSFKRYGGLHIAAEAMGFIAQGQITAAQARVGLVWELLRLRGAMSVPHLSLVLQLSKPTVRCVLAELLKIDAIEALPCMKPLHLRAADLPRPPHWSDYLQGESRAA